jgi:hypothetical protein
MEDRIRKYQFGETIGVKMLIDFWGDRLILSKVRARNSEVYGNEGFSISGFETSGFATAVLVN